MYVLWEKILSLSYGRHLLLGEEVVFEKRKRKKDRKVESVEGAEGRGCNRCQAQPSTLPHLDTKKKKGKAEERWAIGKNGEKT